MTEQKAKTGEHADGFKTATSLAAQGQTKGQLTQMAKEFAAQGRQSYAQGVMHAVLRIIKRERAEAKGHKPQASSDLGPVVITLDNSGGLMVALPDGSVSSAADSRQALRTADTWYESHPHAEKDIQWMCGATAPGMEGIERLPGGLGTGAARAISMRTPSRGAFSWSLSTPPTRTSRLEMILDHLTENPRYYAYLEEMERKMDSATVGDLSPGQAAQQWQEPPARPGA